MRKFTFLMLMLLCAVATWAQVVEGQMYRLKEVSVSNAYLTIQGYNGDGETGAKGTVPFLEKSLANSDQVWFFEKTGTEGQYYLKSKSDYYIVHGGWNVNAYNTESATKGIVELVDNGDETYKLKNINAGKWYKSEIPNGGGEYKYPYCDAAESAACNWVLELVDESEFGSAIEVTYTFTYEGNTVTTQTKTVAEGDNFPEITVTLPFGLTGTVPSETVSAENASQTIELTLSLPFEPAASYDDANMKWYYLLFDSSNKFYLHHDAGQDHIDLNSKAVDKNNKDAYTWAFIGDPINGYKIVNRATGDGYILSSSTTMAGVTGADTWPIMTEEPVAEGNNTYWIATGSTNIANGFFLAQKDYPTNRMNNRGKLAYWTGGAGSGSTFWVEERPMGAAAELEVLIETIENAGITAGTIIGEYTQASVDALNSAVATAQETLTNGTPTAEDVATLQAAYDALAVILPTAGKYYQFHSALAFAETKAVYANGNTAAWKSLNEDDKAFYWEAVATANGIALKNAANGKYLLGNANESGNWSLADDATGAEMGVKIFSTEENEKGYQYGIVIKNWQMHTAGHVDGAGINGNIVSWNTDAANSASAWYIKEVELPTFYTVTYEFAYNGDTKYTQTTELAANAAFPAMTIELPYGVTSDFAIPEGTVTENTTKAFALNIENELPFEAGKWYYVQMHANGNVTSYIQDNKDGIVEWLDKDFASDEIDSHLWKFEGDVFAGIKVINKGTGNAITSTSGDAGTGDAANATAFFPTTSQAGGNWFCLRYPNSNIYLNAQGEQIKSYGDNDNGSSFRLTEYKEHEVTVSAADYATLYLDYNVYIPADVEVYAAASKGSNYVSLAAVEGTIPANQGVILKNAGTYTFKTAPKATAIESNLLAGTVETSDITPAENTTYYVLANGENGVGLYKDELDGGTFRNNANKAYLPVVVESGNAAPSYSFNFDWNGTTAIEGVVAEGAQDGAIYDITGRRVKAITAPGIYIVNGRKVVK